MEYEVNLVSQEFREIYGEEMADEIEEYLLSYPFLIVDD